MSRVIFLKFNFVENNLLFSARNYNCYLLLIFVILHETHALFLFCHLG